MNRSRELGDAFSPVNRLIRSDYCDGDCNQNCNTGGGDSDCDKIAARFRGREVFRGARPVRSARVK